MSRKAQSFFTAMETLTIKDGIPLLVCPTGTKMHVLNLGSLNVDEGW